MLDLETLGTNSNAVLISIGAVCFIPEEMKIISRVYYNIDPNSCEAAGLKVDMNTILWWFKQSDAARKVFEKDSMPLKQALINFSLWLETQDNVKEIKIWGNGATFDNVLIRNAYKAVGLIPPWSFRNDSCYRTLRNMYPHINVDPVGTAHNAVDDAEYQALVLMEILKILPKNLT